MSDVRSFSYNSIVCSLAIAITASSGLSALAQPTNALSRRAIGMTAWAGIAGTYSTTGTDVSLSGTVVAVENENAPAVATDQAFFLSFAADFEASQVPLTIAEAELIADNLADLLS